MVAADQFLMDRYPHGVKNSGAATCPFFCGGSCHPTPGCGESRSAGAADPPSASMWMGFSVRDASHRYTAWIPYNGTRAAWPEQHPSRGYEAGVYEELYDEAKNMSDFDGFDTDNLAYQPQRLSDAARYFNLVRNFFHVLQPPLPAPPPPPAPPESCDKWCSKPTHPWSDKCSWYGCALCPQCAAASPVAGPRTAQAEDCLDKYHEQASCDSDTACAWCTSGAVPAACNTLANAKRLPESVFTCDKVKAAPSVRVYLTTADQSRLFTQLPDIPLGAAPSSPNIRVEPDTTFQAMVGFGAAITDAAAYVLSSSALYDQLMELLFAPHSKGGISLGMLRVPMGVSDFSVSYAVGNITYDDTPNDWSLQHFTTRHDDAYILPVLRRARQLNPSVKIVASPWTAPLWLKTGHQVAPQIGEGSLLDTPQAYETYVSFDASFTHLKLGLGMKDLLCTRRYAEYFVRFVQDYQRKGVLVDYLTLQNEPSHGGCGTMPCMLLPEWQEATLAVRVGQKLQAAGLKTKILGYDHNWGKQSGVAVSGPAYPTALLSNKTVAPYIGGIAWHCYGGSESAQTPVHNLAPDKEVHMTECSGGGWSGPWHSNFISNMRRLFVGGSNNWAQ